MSNQQPPAGHGGDEPVGPYGTPQDGVSPYGSPQYGTPQDASPQHGYPQDAGPPPGYGRLVPPPGYPGAGGGAAYGVDPVTGAPWSDKTRSTAGLLSLLLPLVGVCGVGRLYTGQVGIGLAQLLGFFVGVMLMAVLIGFVIAPAVWLWSVVDGIILLSSGGRDRYGRVLR